ncbi:MAG: Nif3-like dinuclear metal center hexameric protein [Thermodesulfobacteriota bacterium]
MAVKISRIQEWMESRFPASWAEEWDHVGLQLGDPDQEVERLGVSLEAVPRSVSWAIQNRLQLMVCHHPLFFQPFHSLGNHQEPGRSALPLIKENIALIAAHTNLDAAPDGVSTALAGRLGLKGLSPLSKRYKDQVKVVVFIPIGYEEQITKALDDGRSGRIGAYRLCTFKSRGEGTFKADPGSRPFIGEVGRLERASEWRLEIISPRNEVFRLITIIRAAHPYEEMAYDVYPLENPSLETGLGRVGVFDPPVSREDLIRLLKEKVEAPQIRIAGDLPDRIEKAAVCGGSGGTMIPRAISAGVQVLICGEIGYHPLVSNQGQSLTLIEIGHYPSEKWIIPVLAQALRSAGREHRWGIEVKEDLPSGDPHMRYF